MHDFLNQANYNLRFLGELESQFPETYFDWKITVAFYTSLHWMKYFLKSIYNIDASTHEEIRSELKWSNQNQKVTRQCYDAYRSLHNSCMTVRYNGFKNYEDHVEYCKIEYFKCKESLEIIKLYLLKRKIQTDA